MNTEQTPKDKAIAALEVMERSFHNYDHGAPVAVAFLRERTKEALAALRTLSPDALQVDEQKRPATLAQHIGFIRSVNGETAMVSRAMLDEWAKEAERLAHPPKPEQPRVELTDEEIRLQIIRYDDNLEQNTDFDVKEVLQMGTAFGAGMRYARDNGYLAPSKPFPVEEVMEVYVDHNNECPSRYHDESWSDYDKRSQEDFRARILAKFGKPQPDTAKVMHEALQAITTAGGSVNSLEDAVWVANNALCKAHDLKNSKPNDQH